MTRHYADATEHQNGASITAGSTTLTVGTLLQGHGLSGLTAPYTVRVCKADGSNAEEMDVTAVGSYPTVTVTRGINNTTAVSHDTTEIITQVVGVNDMDNVVQKDQDATPTTTGLVEIDQSPPTGHPRAITVAERGAPNGLASVGTDDMLSTMLSPLGGETKGEFAESARWTQSSSNPLFGGANASAAQEPNILIEGTTLKMWYTGSAGSGPNPHMNYATSTDGVTWTQYGSNPVLGNGGSGYAGIVVHSSVTKIDGIYYCYFADNNNGNLKRSTSTDGITWTTPVTVIASNAVAWSLGWNNNYVWQEGYTWYMMLEGSNTGSLFLFTYATSTDGLTWTFPTGGFLSTLQVGAHGMTGGPWMQYPQKRYGLYHLWYHACTTLNGTLPTDIYHATSPDLVTWTITNAGNPILTHTGTGIDQFADPCIVEFGGSTSLYYERVNNSTSDFRMCVATFPGTIAQLIDGARVLAPVPNGFAPLDASGLVPVADLPQTPAYGPLCTGDSPPLMIGTGDGQPIMVQIL